MAPLVSLLQELGLIESRRWRRTAASRQAYSSRVPKVSWRLPRPNTLCGTIDEALRCKAEGIGRTILFNLCGHGHFDMQAYIDYRSGKFTNHAYDEAQLRVALADLPKFAAE